jgi:hypothetical protein
MAQMVRAILFAKATAATMRGLHPSMQPRYDWCADIFFAAVTIAATVIFWLN